MLYFIVVVLCVFFLVKLYDPFTAETPFTNMD